MTARWVVEEVAPHRDLEVTWQPISLLVKNDMSAGSKWYPRYRFTHNLLRVMESVRDDEGNQGVFAAYWEFGRRIHHDRDHGFDPAEALANTGLSREHAAAFDDPARDEEIDRRMAVGLQLAGNDIGTPIIAFDDDNGDRVGLFGPVITRVPRGAEASKLWDGFVAVATTPGFWELKRTRTERPDLGAPPAQL